MSETTGKISAAASVDLAAPVAAGATGSGSPKLNVNLGGGLWYGLVTTGIVIFVVSAMVGIQSFRLGSAKRDLNYEIAAHATTVAVYNLTAAATTEQYRKVETELVNAQQEIENVRTEEMQRTRDVADAYGRDNARMRLALAAYAGGRGSLAPENSCRTEGDRTEAFRVLLDLYMRADGESAKLLESQADDIRALRQWQRKVEAALNETADH